MHIFNKRVDEPQMVNEVTAINARGVCMGGGEYTRTKLSLAS